MKSTEKPARTSRTDREFPVNLDIATRVVRSLPWRLVALILLIVPLTSAVAQSQKKGDADERRLRNELKDREQEIQKLKKELSDERAESKKLEREIDSWKKKPVVPNDNIAVSAYAAGDLFAKDQPTGTGPVVFEIRKGATLLLVWKHGGGKSDGGKSTKWEYVTVRLTPSGATKELRLNLHKGDWSVYRSNPQAGYAHIGDLKVSDKTSTVTVPDE
jgi:predicted RNase H-like nuclease (RuvC/YqgF family)